MFRSLRSCFNSAIRLQHSVAQNEFHHPVVSTLQSYGFTAKQSQKLATKLSNFINKDSSVQMQASFKCWKSNIQVKPKDLENDPLVFHQVFLAKDGRLLLMEPEAINERIEQIKALDLISGQKDLWILFRKAPAGYFLQDWSELLRKYYYITYKIIPWLEKLKDDKHPLLTDPAVIEFAYNTIKSRFLFAQRTGYKELYSQHFSKVTLGSLICTSVDEFLKLHAPNCCNEEYKALEKLNTCIAGKEDDDIFEQLIELAPKTPSKSKESAIKASLIENYVISMPKN